MTLLAENDNQASATSSALLTGPSRAPLPSAARALEGIIDARRLTLLTRSARDFDSGCGGWRFAGRFRSQGIRVHADPKPKNTLVSVRSRQRAQPQSHDSVRCLRRATPTGAGAVGAAE